MSRRRQTGRAPAVGSCKRESRGMASGKWRCAAGDPAVAQDFGWRRRHRHLLGCCHGSRGLLGLEVGWGEGKPSAAGKEGERGGVWD